MVALAGSNLHKGVALQQLEMGLLWPLDPGLQPGYRLSCQGGQPTATRASHGCAGVVH